MEAIGRPRGGTHAVLVVLFVGAFAMGSAELLVMGMLDLISADLAVSIPAAGALVTAFALGMAFGGPLLALVTAHVDRRAVLVGAVAAFALLNLMPVLVADYTLFLVARAGVGATGFETTTDPSGNLESHRLGWDEQLDRLVATLEALRCRRRWFRCAPRWVTRTAGRS